MEIIFGLFVLIAVIAAAGLLFTLWLVWTIVRGVCRAILPTKKMPRHADGGQFCSNTDCRGDNPGHARFCRRCGRPLPSLMRLVDTRAA